MKFFACIMAFLVLALSCMPCADAGAAIKDSKAKTVLTKTTDQQDHEETDECSPFCHCACCAGISINHTVAVISKIPAYFQSHKISFLPSEVIDIASPIWQPPQLV
jgi:hypothetical protein